MRSRRWPGVGRLAAARAARECSSAPRDRISRELAIVAPQTVRSPPHTIRVPRRRAHVGDGRVWLPVRSVR